MPQKKNIDSDSHWKRLIFQWLGQFIDFYCPTLYEHLDTSRPYEFLDKEFEKIMQDDKKKGNKRCDALVKVFLKSGEEKWILIHIEVQHGPDKHFAERMFVYFYRIYDKYKASVEPIAVFTGGDVPPKPANAYISNGIVRQLKYEYAVYKVKDQKEADKIATLEQSNNPFALVTLACLYVMKTKVTDYDKKNNRVAKKQQQRLLFKLRLMRLLHQKGYDRKTIESLFSFIRYVVALPDELEINFIEEIKEKYIKKYTNMESLLSPEDKALFDEMAATYTKIVTEKYEAKIEELAKEKAQADLQMQEEKARAEQEKEQTIRNLYLLEKFTVNQIAVIVQRSEAFVQAVLDKYEFGK